MKIAIEGRLRHHRPFFIFYCDQSQEIALKKLWYEILNLLKLTQ